jgi:hypothetical protein
MPFLHRNKPVVVPVAGVPVARPVGVVAPIAPVVHHTAPLVSGAPILTSSHCDDVVVPVATTHHATTTHVVERPVVETHVDEVVTHVDRVSGPVVVHESAPIVTSQTVHYGGGSVLMH